MRVRPPPPVLEHNFKSSASSRSRAFFVSWVDRSCSFRLLLLFVIWRARSGILTPQNPVERAIWSLWIAYILSYLSAEIMVRLPGGDGTNLYAVMSLVSGVILLALGGHLWGACYLIGGAFLAMAPLLTAIPKYGILSFGGLWSLTFFLLGRRYGKQSSDM